MILAIAIGNTTIRFGIFENKKILGSSFLDTSPKPGQHEIRTAINSLCLHRKTRSNEIKGAVICSVVPALTHIVRSTVKKYLRADPLIISTNLDLGTRIHYANPRTLGVDRLCGAIAAYHKYGGPAIIIDFGTATTFNVVSKDGDFLGGLIAPGVETSAEALHMKTAKLPRVRVHTPTTLIGNSTITAMQAGVFYAALDGMEGIVKRIKGKIGKKAVVIATGGLSTLIAPRSSIIDHIEPDLVLEGACLVYNRIKRHPQK